MKDLEFEIVCFESFADELVEMNEREERRVEERGSRQMGGLTSNPLTQYTRTGPPFIYCNILSCHLPSHTTTESVGRP